MNTYKKFVYTKFTQIGLPYFMNFNYFLELYNIYNMQKLQCQSNITCGVFEIKFFSSPIL